MEVRQLRDSEHRRLYRELRLRALADAPCVRIYLAEEQAEPYDFWIVRTAASADVTTLLALSEGRALGMVTVRLQGETPEQARLLAMWVAPEWRRRGAGRKLIAEAAEWARRKGATRLTLWVTDDNSAGRGLYRACGFGPTPSGTRSALTRTSWRRPCAGSWRDFSRSPLSSTRAARV